MQDVQNSRKAVSLYMYTDSYQLPFWINRNEIKSKYLFSEYVYYMYNSLPHFSLDDNFWEYFIKSPI